MEAIDWLTTKLTWRQPYAEVTPDVFSSFAMHPSALLRRLGPAMREINLPSGSCPGGFSPGESSPGDSNYQPFPRITALDLTPLVSLPNLVKLNMGSFSANSLGPLHGLTCLQHLDLSDTNDLADLRR